MPANAVNTGICACQEQQFGPIVFNTVAYQTSANTIYNAKFETVDSSGTIRTANGNIILKSQYQGNGNPIFKSQYERMQYLLGKLGAGGCGVQPKVFALGTN